MMNEYEIGNAFQAIEEELMASMIRNMKRHRVEEITEEMDWSMWQAEQLTSLRNYQKENRLKYTKTFDEMNASIDGIIAKARKTGGLEEEIKILEGMKRGFKPGNAATGGISHEQFFKLNTHKLEALSRATVNDIKNAQTGILRMSNDKYRQIIFKAQVYANTGAGTYAKAVDMATKDYLEAGINCIEYKNGARHTPANYSRMCIRTASKRAKLTGEGEKRKEYGITTVILNKRGNPCPVCMPFVGKVFIDDVWSGGTAKDGPYPLLSQAIAAGLYHPNCKDGHTTYFPEMDEPEEATDEEQQAADETYQGEQTANYATRQFDKFSRLSALSLDPENQARYQAKADEWKAREKLTLAKSIDLEDFETVADIEGFDSPVAKEIASTIKEFEQKEAISIPYFRFIDLGESPAGSPLLQIQPIQTRGSAVLQFNVNSRLAHRSKPEIDSRIKSSKLTVASNLREAVIHEIGHAKLINGLTYEKIEELYNELLPQGVAGISRLAMRDGAEAIAEIYVLLQRGVKLDNIALELYNKYIIRR